MGFFNEKFFTIALIIAIPIGWIIYSGSKNLQEYDAQKAAQATAVSAEATAQAPCYTELTEFGKEYSLVRGFTAVLTFPGVVEINNNLKVDFAAGELFEENDAIGFPIITFYQGQVLAELAHCGYP